MVALSRVGGPLRPEERDRVLRAVELLRRDALTIDTVVRVALPMIYATGVEIDARMRKRMLRFARTQYSAACVEVPPEPKRSNA